MLDVFSRYVAGWMVAHGESATLAEKFYPEKHGEGDLMIRSLAFVCMVALAIPVVIASAQLSCQQIGNQTFCSNGQTFQRFGNQTFDNRGNSWQQLGNQTFGSNGTACQRIGNQVFCNK